jgi:four helix bundle protein
MEIDIRAVRRSPVLAICGLVSRSVQMTEAEFKRRTMDIALRSIKLVQELPRDGTAQVIGKQFVRCATSVGANYRAACRAKSVPDMLHKLAIVEEEADEAGYWLELLIEANIVPKQRIDPISSEFNEIVAMIVVSIKSLRKSLPRNATEVRQ